MLGLPELGGERGDRLLGFLSRDVLSRGDLPLLLLLPRLPLRRRPRWELCCSFFRHDLFLLQWPLDPEEELELSESEALSSLGRDEGLLGILVVQHKMYLFLPRSFV